MMRSKPQSRGAYAAYSDPKSSSKNIKKKGVSFGPDTNGTESKSSEEMKESYQANRNRGDSRRDSIWDGVLDVNNIIMVPETPKWRPRFSFQQNQLLQEGLLDSILYTISPKGYHKSSKNNDQIGLVDEVQVTSVDAMCLFLPFLCVVSSKLSSNTLSEELKMAILQRVMKEDDVKQHFQFFLNSYKDAPELKKSFNKANNSLMKQISSAATNTNPSTPNINNMSPTFASSTLSDGALMDDLSLNNNTKSSPPSIASSVASQSVSSGSSKSSSTKQRKPQNIIQQRPESAISLFNSIFRNNLPAGSEIKLCRESSVTDPINCHAPPLSRIEIRKIIGTNSKPYLVDLYVANRSDNFEYLSSTVILKKGDDLRRDAAVLHVFRLMNKIWREKGLEFTQVPVNALTYKCIAMSPDFGMIELIEGCKPLRLVSALEDTITIAQQFNLVASAAGSYMASYVMGVRDRHFDNVLIRDTDCTLFHIDFGFVLGIHQYFFYSFAVYFRFSLNVHDE